MAVADAREGVAVLGADMFVVADVVRSFDVVGAQSDAVDLMASVELQWVEAVVVVQPDEALAASLVLEFEE